MTHNTTFTNAQSPQLLTNNEATAVAIGTPVYSNAAGGFMKALADASAKQSWIGIVVGDPTVAAGAQTYVQLVGAVTASAAQWDAICGTSGGLAYGTTYYLSSSVAGTLTTSSASGVPVLFALSATLAKLVTGSGGGGGLSGLTSGVLPVATGGAAIGNTNINTQALMNGPTLQSFSIPNPAYAYGELNRMEIGGVVPAYPADLFILVIRSSALADCSTHDQHSGGAAIEVTGSRSAGANTMKNTGLELIASGAQNNEALSILAGDFNMIGGGAITLDGNIFGGTGNSNYIASTGYLVAYGSGAYGIYLGGTPTDNIRCVDPSMNINVFNASNSTLELQNTGGGGFTVIVDGDVRLGSSTGPRVLSGSGSPETVVTAPVGSLYLRTNGGAGTSLYVKESGSGNTGWVGK